MRGPTPDDVREGTVADFDQLHAHAIDELRRAETFLLAVPKLDEDGAPVSLEIIGGGQQFVAFKTATSAVLNAETWDEIARFLKRDKWLRLFLLAAATANVVLVIVNLGRLVA
jgi:hypothetical protein